MSVIISLSPWSSFWTMGNGGGTPSELIAVECLKEINPDVLHFVEDGHPCDEGNIAIPVHMQALNIWKNRFYSRLGKIGRNVLFIMKTRKWRLYNYEFFDQVIAVLAQKKIDSVTLIYCNSSLLVECGRKLGETYNCPVVSHFYGTFLAPCIGKHILYKKYATEYLGWMTPVDLRICNDDGTSGIEVARDLGLPLDKFLFQPHGINTKELSIECKEDITGFMRKDIQYVMTSSRLDGWKRIDRIIHSIPKVVHSIGNVQFLIIGDGPERIKLENLAKETGVSNWVTFVGPVPRSIVFSFMRKCDVFVSTNDVSNISRGLKEAMFLGMCIVTLDTGDTQQLIMNRISGMLLPPDDSLELSKSLIEVLSDKNLRISLGREAKSIIEKNEPTQETIINERLIHLRSVIDRFKKK